MVEFVRGAFGATKSDQRLIKTRVGNEFGPSQASNAFGKGVGVLAQTLDKLS
jgi:hypothetical protein